MKNWEVYQGELDRYREELENDNHDVQQDVLDMEMKLNEEIQLRDEEDAEPFEKLLGELKAVKQEFDFYDEEGELDMMFPDRHDDFDEDSMSGRSVFGDD